MFLYKQWQWKLQNKIVKKNLLILLVRNPRLVTLFDTLEKVSIKQQRVQSLSVEIRLARDPVLDIQIKKTTIR